VAPEHVARVAGHAGPALDTLTRHELADLADGSAEERHRMDDRRTQYGLRYRYMRVGDTLVARVSGPILCTCEGEYMAIGIGRSIDYVATGLRGVCNGLAAIMDEPNRDSLLVTWNPAMSELSLRETGYVLQAVQLSNASGVAPSFSAIWLAPDMVGTGRQMVTLETTAEDSDSFFNIRIRGLNLMLIGNPNGSLSWVSCVLDPDNGITARNVFVFGSNARTEHSGVSGANDIFGGSGAVALVVVALPCLAEHQGQDVARCLESARRRCRVLLAGVLWIPRNLAHPRPEGRSQGRCLLTQWSEPALLQLRAPSTTVLE
jgi:hypothetical protein